ncbi:MAG: HNH endonuclease, partial [Actinomycetota bacterium]|nr:HNH endonuclease [Actinomycetota bacterium]
MADTTADTTGIFDATDLTARSSLVPVTEADFCGLTKLSPNAPTFARWMRTKTKQSGEVIEGGDVRYDRMNNSFVFGITMTPMGQIEPCRVEVIYRPDMNGLWRADFSPHAVFETTLDPSLPLDRYVHFQVANAALVEALNADPELGRQWGLSPSDVAMLTDATPDPDSPHPSYAWHHVDGSGRIQLVNRAIHARFGHFGGFSEWGNPAEAFPATPTPAQRAAQAIDITQLEGPDGGPAERSRTPQRAGSGRESAPTADRAGDLTGGSQTELTPPVVYENTADQGADRGAGTADQRESTEPERRGRGGRSGSQIGPMPSANDHASDNELSEGGPREGPPVQSGGKTPDPDKASGPGQASDPGSAQVNAPLADSADISGEGSGREESAVEALEPPAGGKALQDNSSKADGDALVQPTPELIAELADLFNKLHSASPLTRWRAAHDAAALLVDLGLVSGLPNPETGDFDGRSPGFEQRLAELAEPVQILVAQLNALPQVGSLPSAVDSLRRTLSRGFLTGVVAGGLPAFALSVAAVEANVPKLLTFATVAASAAIFGSVANSLARQRYNSREELLSAFADARLPQPSATRQLIDMEAADLASQAAQIRQHAADGAPRLHSGPARTEPLGHTRDQLHRGGPASPVSDAAGAERSQRLKDAADPTAGDRVSAADRLPSLSAWIMYYTSGPVSGLGAGALAHQILVTYSSLPGMPVVFAFLGVGAVGALINVACYRVVFRRRIAAKDRRAAVEDAHARAWAQVRIESATRASHDQRAALDERAQHRRALKDRLDSAEQALIDYNLDPDAGLPPEVAPLPSVDPASTDPADPEPEEGPPLQSGGKTPDSGKAGGTARGSDLAERNQLVPGPAHEPIDPANLTDADRSRLADLMQLLDSLDTAGPWSRRSLAAAYQAALRACGLELPTSADDYPEILATIRRRAVLDPALFARVAAHDPLPPTTASLAWYQAKWLGVTAVPASVTPAVIAELYGTHPAYVLLMITSAASSLVVGVVSAFAEWSFNRSEARRAELEADNTTPSDQILAHEKAYRERVAARVQADQAESDAADRELEERRLRYEAARARAERSTGLRSAALPAKILDTLAHRSDPDPNISPTSTSTSTSTAPAEPDRDSDRHATHESDETAGIEGEVDVAVEAESRAENQVKATRRLAKRRLAKDRLREHAGLLVGAPIASAAVTVGVTWGIGGIPFSVIFNPSQWDAVNQLYIWSLADSFATAVATAVSVVLLAVHVLGKEAPASDTARERAQAKRDQQFFDANRQARLAPLQADLEAAHAELAAAETAQERYEAEQRARIHKASLVRVDPGNPAPPNPPPGPAKAEDPPQPPPPGDSPSPSGDGPDDHNVRPAVTEAEFFERMRSEVNTTGWEEEEDEWCLCSPDLPCT